MPHNWMYSSVLLAAAYSVDIHPLQDVDHWQKLIENTEGQLSFAFDIRHTLFGGHRAGAG